MLRTFLIEGMAPAPLQDFLQSVYYGAEVDILEYRSCTNLLLVHNGLEYDFSSDELSWLSDSSIAFTCKTNFGYDIFCIKLNCCQSDYYTICAAIIKLFSKAFGQAILFMFYFSNSIAFGCKRDIDHEIADNFCVTQPFDIWHETLAMDFLAELPLMDCNELSWLICSYSPQEQQVTKTNRQSIDSVSNDFLLAIEEFRSIYSESIESTIHFDDWPEDQKQFVAQESYQEAKKVLSNIAEGERISSYDILEQTIATAERIAQVQEQLDSDTIKITETNDKPFKFSAEAFLHADKMLEEMLDP